MKDKDLYKFAYDALFSVGRHMVIIHEITDEYTPGKIIDINKNLLERLGYEKNELIGKSLFDIIYDSNSEVKRKRAKNIINHILKNNTVHFEAVMLRKDNTPLPVEVNAYVIRNQSSLFILGIIKDIKEFSLDTFTEESWKIVFSLIENLPVGIILYERNGNIIYLNSRIKKDLYIDGGISGGDLDKLLPKQMAKQLTEADSKIIKSEHVVFEKIIPDKKGKERVFKIHKFPLLWEGKTLIAGIIENITARKKIQETLHQQMVLNEKIIHAANAVIVLLDENSDILLFNDYGSKITGYQIREVINKNFIEIFVDETNRDNVRKRFKKLFKEAPAETDYEDEIIVKNGEKRIIRWYCSFLKDENEKIAAVLCIGLDITEWKQTHEMLIRLRTAVEQAAEVIMITDKNGTILYVNPVFEEVTGYAVKEVVGGNPRILKSGKHSEKFYRNLWNTIQSGNTWHGHFINKRKDGTLYEEDAVISPIRDNITGEIINYVAVKHDVTNQILMENQLRQSQKMDAIGKLAGGIAHDFNNLIMVITNAAKFALASTPTDSPIKQDLDQIIKAGERAAELTRQLLTFSRQQTINPVLCDLNHAVSDVEVMLKRLIPEDITINFVYAGKPLHVHIDKGQINQVLVNLIVNARDAMPQGGTIIVKLKKSKIDMSQTFEFMDVTDILPGEYALIEVIDTGIGIPDEIKDNIFEPFFTTKGQGQGTGLGLSTVYGIIKQHEGYISVKSKQHEGTIFRIFLPLHSEEMYDPEEDMASQDIRKGNETIIFVEDGPFVRTMTSRMLKTLGYRIFEFSNGYDAIKFVHQHKADIKIDILITDVVMPAIDGKTLASKIGELIPDLKVLFISGYPDQYLASKGVYPDEDRVLKKPFTLTNLSNIIRQIMD